MAEETPSIKVEEFAITGSITGKLEDILSKISNSPFFSAKIENNELLVTKIESRDINKKPFLFYILAIKEEGMTVTYSIAPDTSEKLRKLTVIKNVAAILSMINENFHVDETKFFQYIDSAIEDVLNSLSQSYSVLFNRYDALVSEYRELKRQNLELIASNRNLTIEAAQLKDENSKLSEELKVLQTFSDESLMAMVEDWIIAHNSTIDIDEFAKTYKIPSPRVEQILNKMVSQGYLELKS
ncbi:MAG: hypothetical protein ACP5K9_01360 [Candidatus Micrarchaeia archaeon]